MLAWLKINNSRNVVCILAAFLKYQIKLFTISQLLSFHPCWRIRATKCVQRTMALYRYKLFKVFPFSLIEFCKAVMFKNWIQYVWSKTGILFSFLRLARPPFGLWLRTLYYKWKNILLRASTVWFLLYLNSLRFSLHLADSVAREFQKSKCIVPFLSSLCSKSQI